MSSYSNWRIAMRAVLLVVAAVVGVSGCDTKSSLEEEKAAIVDLVQSVHGGASSATTVEPVVVRTKYGVADWTQGDTGGRVLVQKDGRGWKVVATAGEEMRDASFLTKQGVPELEAKALANSLIATERQLPGAQLDKFDKYAANTPR
jgi:hypothetical protein